MAQEDAAADVVKDARGVVEEFVGVLVLVDIVLGGLTLYWARLAIPDAARQLPGTGYQVVDVALLACAAAIVGKLVSLLARGVTAVVFLRVAAGQDGPFAGIGAALLDYRKTAENGARGVAELERWGKERSWREHWGELLGSAVAHLATADPRAAERLERERSTAAFTYGVAVLVILFGAHLGLRLHWWVGLLALIAAATLLYSGRVQQRGYLRALASGLEGARTALLAARSVSDTSTSAAPRNAAPAPEPAQTEATAETRKP